MRSNRQRRSIGSVGDDTWCGDVPVTKRCQTPPVDLRLTEEVLQEPLSWPDGSACDESCRQPELHVVPRRGGARVVPGEGGGRVRQSLGERGGARAGSAVAAIEWHRGKEEVRRHAAAPINVVLEGADREWG
jgi:hypothetical protein